MINFIHAINGFYTNDLYYTDTDSLHIENEHWDKLDKAEFVGKKLLQGKNDYKDGGINLQRTVSSTQNKKLINHS